MFEFNETKHKKARQVVIWGGMVILVAITLLSCVSSFMIYKEGFADLPVIFQFALALFAVIVVEGAFMWLVYGFTMAFSSFWERLLSFLGMWFLAAVMLLNILTHFMMVKNVPLSEFQQSWLAWGAVTIFIGVLVLVLAIRLADSVIRFIRLELRFLGKQQEHQLTARRDGLDTQVVHDAMAKRAELEAEQLAAKILGAGQYLRPHTIKGFSDGGGSHSYGQKDTEIIKLNPGNEQKKLKAADETEAPKTRRFDSH
jgi:hypothetical protein